MALSVALTMVSLFILTMLFELNILGSAEKQQQLFSRYYVKFVRNSRTALAKQEYP